MSNNDLGDSGSAIRSVGLVRDGAPLTNPPVKTSRRKRRRKDNSDTTADEEQAKRTCLFEMLPHELLSEILIYTQSPQTALAVARCSKFLCMTMTNPSSTYIWRKTRQAANPPPPEPFVTFTESAYASFLYDPGLCEICQRETSRMFVSFALKLRVCKRCGGKGRAMKNIPLVCPAPVSHGIETPLIPVTESATCVGEPERAGTWPHTFPYCRRSSLESIWDDSQTVLDFIQTNGLVIKRNHEWMKFCVSLHKWKNSCNVEFHVNKGLNVSACFNIASQNGWNYDDVIKHTSIGALLRWKNKFMDRLNTFDFEFLIETVDAELVALEAKRQRGKSEAAYRVNSAEIKTHYNRLRSSHSHINLPNLVEFRGLPIINLFQGTKTISDRENSGISTTLNGNPLVSTVLTEQLNDWTKKARDELGAVLGFPSWQTSNIRMVHPVERFTTRFKCKECNSVALRYAADECLDFQGACSHECTVQKGKKKGKEKAVKKWNAEKFYKDEQAMAALESIQRILKLDGPYTRSATVEELNNLLPFVVCKSCDPPIILPSKSVLGHSHRHDGAMELKRWYSPDTANYIESPLPVWGLAQKLLGLSNKAKSARELKNYGCSHCLNKKREEGLPSILVAVGDSSATSTDVQTQTQASSRENVEVKSKLPQPLFNFNGMRSHLKAKHHLEKIRDEDFYCAKEINL